MPDSIGMYIPWADEKMVKFWSKIVMAEGTVKDKQLVGRTILVITAHIATKM